MLKQALLNYKKPRIEIRGFFIARRYILLWIDMIYIKIRFDIHHIYFSYDDKFFPCRLKFSARMSENIQRL